MIIIIEVPDDPLIKAAIQHQKAECGYEIVSDWVEDLVMSALQSDAGFKSSALFALQQVERPPSETVRARGPLYFRISAAVRTQKSVALLGQKAALSPKQQLIKKGT
jgi:hypothetical protein